MSVILIKIFIDLIYLFPGEYVYIRNAVHQQYFICLLSFFMRLHLGFEHEIGACTCT